ncbi:MAG: TrbI F-type domain-containing protein [Gammaproteobacteria bacterium]
MNAGLVVTVIIAALVGSATTLLTERWMEQPRKLATVDPGVLVAEHLQNIDPGMDEDAIESRSQAYAKRLDAAVARVARKYHVVLLVKPSVITGAPDLTGEVRRMINEQAR